jgi:SAM-dependent methyltransferase
LKGRQLWLLLAALLTVLLAAALGAVYLRQPATVAPAPAPAILACAAKHEMNSKAYWDCRFGTQDWQSRHGDKQSEYFYGILVEFLPQAVKDEIRDRKYSVVDFGCAQGEGTELFARAFPGSKVTGVDISTEAVRIARQKNKLASFLAADLTTHPGEWDVMITSNTLEHFREPWDMAERLSGKIGKYIIILVPFEEPNVPRPNYEHFYSFGRENIPQALGRFRLASVAVLETVPQWWRGMQVLLVYKRDS